MRVAIVANTSWYLYNFRRNLMNALRTDGHEILAIGPEDDYAGRLREEGYAHMAVPFFGGSINPVREARTVVALSAALRRWKAGLVLSFTPKGNIYSGLTARWLGVPFVPNISGLGRAFIRPSPVTHLVRVLYRATLAGAPTVFFQNDDDRDAFVRSGLVNPQRAVRLPGSGVDLAHFRPPSTEEEGPFIFLLVARLLWDKGIGEYVQAARRIRKLRPDVRFELLGFVGIDNPAAVPRAELDAWVKEGVIQYLGATDDVRPHLARAHCVVLPSYREGLPRSLLEAAAMARPIVTTDAPGCRDTVEDGRTGFLCRPRDANDLEKKMLRMLDLPAHERRRMGLRGRAKMVREFDERLVIEAYRTVIGCARSTFRHLA